MRIKSGALLVLLLSSMACSKVECGEGTILRDGKCVVATSSATKQAEPESAAARRALAQKLTAGEFVARTAGADDTVLEFTSKVRGCRLESLMPIVNKSGQTMVDLGFIKLRCMDSGDYVDLDSRAPAPQANVKTSAPVETTAGALYQEYKTNEIGADAKYSGKILLVKGIVERVGKDSRHRPFVEFHVAGGRETLRASFATNTGLAELKRIDAIAIRCRGGSQLGSPTLSECLFEKVLEEPNSGSAER